MQNPEKFIEREMELLDASWTPAEREIFREFLIEEEARRNNYIIPDYEKLNDIDVLDSGDLTPEEHVFTSKFLKAYRDIIARREAQ